MVAIFLKEFKQFYSSLIGYIAMVVFLLAIGLFIWIFPDTNILDFGYATLDALFDMGPIFFMFLIPAITMRSLAEEINTGTYELLATRPITQMQIILGKYLAALALVFLTLVPTVIYYITIYRLATPVGNVDTGGIIGSYIGLLLLGAVFVSIGIFCSAVTSNQIVAFILGVFLCFFIYLAFDYLSRLGIFFGKNDYLVQQFGIKAHYQSISKGVIDTRDLIYFAGCIALFIFSTKTVLESRKW